MSRFVVEPVGLLFLHIPRTGGTWIERALRTTRVKALRWPGQDRRYPSKHLPWPLFGTGQRNRTKLVAVTVRHPVKYYEAVWRWMHGLPENKIQKVWKRWEWHPHGRAAKWMDRDFNVWVRRMVEEEPAWVTRLIELFCGPENAEWVDWIGRTRTLERDFVELMEVVGRSLTEEQLEGIREIGKANEGMRVDVSWDEGLRREVEAQEAVAIRRFWGLQTKARRRYGKLVEKRIVVR